MSPDWEGGKRESDREAGPYAKGQSHWCVMSDTLRMLYGRGERLEAVRERFGERDGSAKQWFVTRRGPDSEGRGRRMGMPHLYGPQSGGGAGIAHDDGAKVLPMAGKERRKPGRTPEGHAKYGA